MYSAALKSKAFWRYFVPRRHITSGLGQYEAVKLKRSACTPSDGSLGCEPGIYNFISRDYAV